MFFSSGGVNMYNYLLDCLLVSKRIALVDDAEGGHKMGSGYNVLITCTWCRECVDARSVLAV